MLADVGEREFGVGQLGHAEDVGDQLAREADAARADDGDLQARNVRLPIPAAISLY